MTLSVRDESPREGVADRLRRLSPEARTALRERLSSRTATREAVEPLGHHGPAPLSFAQRRLGFIERLEEGAVHHNDGMLLFLDGRLDPATLAASITGIVRRHEVLRSAFRVVDGELLQVATEARPVDLPVLDLPAARMDDTDPVLLDAFRAEMRRPLALADGVPLRPVLFRISATEHVLGVTIHHLVCDLWSFSVFAEEIGEIYRALSAGREHGLPPLPLQYADYARRQRAQLTEERLAPHVAYWTAALRDAPVEHSLPIHRPRPATQGFVGAVERFTVDAETVERLKAWGQPRGFTLFMTLLAAFDVLLAKYGGHDDVVVVTPIATRGEPGLERLIGCFLNMLPLRLDVSGDPTFAEVVGRARAACLDAYAHQELPFDLLVQACQPVRSRSHQPIAQVAFALQNTPVGAAELPGLSVRFHKADTGRARLDLSVWVTADANGLAGELEYDTELFDRDVVADLGRRYGALLRAVAERPDAHLRDLDLRTPEELRAVVAASTGPVVDFGPALVIPALVEAQAARTPDAPAIISDTDRMTYAELNGRANSLSRFLRERGVGPEVPVAVCLPRSADEVVAILGVLKAGGVYVPIGVSDPPARRTAVLRAVAPRVVLATGDLADDLWAPDRDVVDLAAERAAIARYDDTDPAPAATPDNLAYVLFTSGSTGEPKGVLVPHRGFCNRMLWGQHNYPLGPDDRVLRKAAPTFDVSLDELFRALFNGAASVQLAESRVFDPVALAHAIQRHGVTDADFSPSALGAFLSVPAAAGCTSLRRIVSGVEALSPALVERLFATLDVDLFNLYGPTEVSVSCTAWRCVRGAADAVMPIGYPMANVRVYVLDANLVPVMPGVVGEIYVAGAGLARGYLNRGDLTAERFLPDSVAGLAGERMYRTGDLGRRRADGVVEFVGRADAQLNVRGYRVEPGEIQARLVEHPGVGNAAVVPAAGPGSTRLVGYVTPAGDRPPDHGDLREWLRAQLPEYLVPAAFVTVDTLPMTRHGKLDVAALPPPDLGVAGAGGGRVEPASHEERVLAAIWADVLALPEVGVRDDFFELGGDSLTAVRVVARAAEELGHEVEVAAIFDNPTVEALARRFTAATAPR